MRFSHLETLLAPHLVGWTMVPGPTDPSDLPRNHIIATSYGGPGEDADGALDFQSWQIRVIGQQNDYSSAEDKALDIDKYLLGLHSSRIANGPWLVSVARVGGAPAALTKDSAKRYHFIGSYIFQHELALVN